MEMKRKYLGLGLLLGILCVAGTVKIVGLGSALSGGASVQVQTAATACAPWQRQLYVNAFKYATGTLAGTSSATVFPTGVTSLITSPTDTSNYTNNYVPRFQSVDTAGLKATITKSGGMTAVNLQTLLQTIDPGGKSVLFYSGTATTPSGTKAGPLAAGTATVTYPTTKGGQNILITVGTNYYWVFSP